MYQKIKQLVEFPSLSRVYKGWLRQKEQKEIIRILSRPEPPHYYDSEKTFEQLQNAYFPRTGYKYDSFSTWSRGTQRALKLIQVANLHEPGFSILDAGCGDGMTGYMLACYGHYVKLLDLEDWRDARTKNIPFVYGDLCSSLPLESNSFDLVFSYNTFEHVANPKVALAELVRVCKKDGLIYLQFDPLYASPWGLHAYRTIFMPYSQFLFSPSFINQKLQELNIYDLGKKRTTLQPMNQWRLSQFEHLWQTCNCDIINVSFVRIFSHLKIIMQFPNAFSGLGLTFEDVTTKEIQILLRKEDLEEFLPELEKTTPIKVF